MNTFFGHHKISIMNKFVCVLVLGTMILIVENYGSNATEHIEFYELKKGDFYAKITNYGATVLSIIVPDKHGKLDDIVLGYESVESYKNDTTYFGAIVGRVANRIADAQFSLNGNSYKLPANDHGKQTLHGGDTGFADVLWTMTSHKIDSHITFTYDSSDGEMGFPGALSVTVTYRLVGTHQLAIQMEAKPLDKPTPVNLASHTYFNLAGHNSGKILSHHIQIFGSHITPVDENLIPTGEIASVKATPYDFLTSASIESKIEGLEGGYDINYVVDSNEEKHLKAVAVVHDKTSGRKMELWSNQVGVQFYTGNMLGTEVGGKQGAVYTNHTGLCLETQGFPDSVNHKNFPSQIVNPGETYEHIMVYRFTATSHRHDSNP